MSITDIQAVDVHAHYGPYHDQAKDELANAFHGGDAAEVARRARACHTQWTVVSPLSGLLPRGGADAAAGNEEAARVVPATDGLLQWVIVNPLQQRTYDQARAMLKHRLCVGIKIHPEEHVYPIREHGEAIYTFAEEVGAVVMAHSGDVHSLPADYVPFANRFPKVKLILAHIGHGLGAGGEYDLQVRAMTAARHGNLYADTSSAKSITPGLIEWAVKQAGVEKILYGTDTPLYLSAMQRARIDHADLNAADKRRILRDNAVELLGLKERGLVSD